MRIAGAVDIGGTRTKVGIVGNDGSIRQRATFPTPKAGEPKTLVVGIVATLAPMLEAEASAGTKAYGIGVSVAGFLDRDHSKMTVNANMPALCGFPLRDALRDVLKLDVHLEVDSNASTIAEFRYGAGRNARRLLGVTIGTGLGGGVIVDGALLRHTGECAGDIGHIIVKPDGRQCTCGARGCLEAMVCSAALSERAGGHPVRQVVSDARNGDRRAADAIKETAYWLGLGLASLSPLFAPNRIVVGGGVASAGDLLLDPARESYRSHASIEFTDSVEIVGSQFDGWEGMVGAASIVFE